MKGLLKRILALAIATVMLVSMATNAYAATFTLPSDLKTIEAEAFEGDQAIEKVVLPDGVKTIGSRAFADSSLESINLPRSLTSIADDAFEESPKVVANVKSGSYAMTYCVDNNIPYVTDPVNVPNALVPISVSASASTVEMGDTVTLTFTADEDLAAGTRLYYNFDVFYLNAAGEVISTDRWDRSKLGDLEMLVQCAGAAKLRISLREGDRTTPGAHPAVEIAVTGSDSKPYLEYSVVGEVYPGGKLRATVVAMNADKLTAAETVTITDEMGSFTKTVTVSAKTPKVSVDVTVPRTWNWYDEDGDYQFSYGVIFKHGSDEYTHYAYGEPLCDPSVESWVGDFFTIYTRVLPSEMPYTYAIADTSVATIDENAKITFLAPGTTTGTLTTKSGIVFPFEVNVYEEESEGGSGSTPANDLVLYVSAPRSVVDIDAEEIPIFYIYSDVEGSLENHYDESIPICFSFYDADGQLMDTIESEQWLEGDSYEAVWPEWSWWANRIDGDYSYIEFSFGDTEYEVIEPSTARVRVRSWEEQGKMGFLGDDYYGECSIGQTVTVPLTCTTPDLLAEYAAQGEVKVTAVVPYHSGEEIIKDVVPAVFDADTLTATLSFTIGEDAIPGQGYEIVLYCGTQQVSANWCRIAFGVNRIVQSMSMVTGERRALPITLPEGADFSKVYFKVDNPSVLSVDANGVVTALAAGDTDVYVYYQGLYGSVAEEYFRISVYDPATESLPVLTVTPLADTVAFGEKLPIKVQLSGDTSEMADSGIEFVLEMTFLDENKNYLTQSGWWRNYTVEELTGDGQTFYCNVWTSDTSIYRAAYMVVTSLYGYDAENAAFALEYDYSFVSLTDVPDGKSTLYKLTLENENPEDIRQGDWVYFGVRRLPQWIGRDVTLSLRDAKGNELASSIYDDGNYSCRMNFDTRDLDPNQPYTISLFADDELVDSVSFDLGEPRLSFYSYSSRMVLGNTSTVEYGFNSNYDCPVTFSSSDESVASIEDENVVRALGKGKTTITATCEHGQTATVDVIVYDPDSAYVPAVYLSTDMAGTAEWLNSLRYKIGVSGDLTEIPYGYMEFNPAVQVLDADGNVLYNSADEGTYTYAQHSLQVNEQYQYWNNSNVWYKAAELDGRFIRLVLTTNTQNRNNYTIDESRSSVTFELEPLEECTTPIVGVNTPSTIAKGEPIEVTFTCYNPDSLGSGMTVKLMQNWDEDNPLVQGRLTRANPSVTLSYTPDDSFTYGDFQYGYGHNASSFYVRVFTYHSLGVDAKMSIGNYRYFYPKFDGSSVSLTYTSSDESVATATGDGGRVRVDAVAQGTTVITGTAPNGESRSFTVTVYDSNNTVTPVFYLDQSQNGATREWEEWVSLTLKTDTDPWKFSSVYVTVRMEYLDADGNVLGSDAVGGGTNYGFVTQTDTLTVRPGLTNMVNYYAQGARSVRFTLIEESGYTVDEANASVTMNIADPMQCETPIIYYTLPQYSCGGDTFDVTFTCINPQSLGEGVRCAVRGDGDEEAIVLLLTQEQPSATYAMTVPEQYANYSGYYVYCCTNYDVEYPQFDYRSITLLRGSISISNAVLEIESTTQASVYLYNQYDELSLTWESADPSIATVDENGVVTGVSVGVTQILAHYGLMTLTQAIRVYDAEKVETPEYYLVNANPDQTAGPELRGTFYLGTTTALDKLGGRTGVSYQVEGVDAQGEVVRSLSTTSMSRNFIDSNEVTFSVDIYSDNVISAMYAGATHLRIRLLESDSYTVDAQRSDILIPISDPSTWEATTFYMDWPEVFYPGQEVTLDVDMVSCQSSMTDVNFVCTVYVSANGEYLLESTEQIINASNPSVNYTFSVPENVSTSSAYLSMQIREQDSGYNWNSRSGYVNFAYFTQTQSDTAVAKGSTFSAYYSGYGLSYLSKSFESSNPEVATVDENGTVTGVSVGVATITAHYGELEHSFAVRVYDAETMVTAKLSLSAPESLTEWPWTGKGELLLTADQPVENLGNLTRVTVYSYFYNADGTQVGRPDQYISVALIDSNQVAIPVSTVNMASMAAAGAVTVKHVLSSYSGNGFSIDSNAKSVVLPMQPLAESSEPLLYSNTSSSNNYLLSNGRYMLDIHAGNTSYSSPVTVVAYANVSGSRVEFDRVTFTPSEGADVELTITPPDSVSSFVVHAACVNSDDTETILGSYNIQVIPAPVAVTTLAELQSAHPYENNFSYVWSYTVEGAESLAITFDSESKTESTYDPLRVGSLYGFERGRIEHTLDGTFGDETVTVDGDTVIIWLKTDGSAMYHGFAVTQIEATMADGSTVTITE